MNWWFYFANIIFVIGTLPNIHKVLLDRDSLKGYSLFGAIFTLLGILLINVGVFTSGEPLAVLIVIPVIVYWFLVISFKVNIRKGVSENV